jgi:hypothetical protein
MFYCEDCRVKKNWNRPITFPYHEHHQGTCEVCKHRKDCYDYPAMYVRPKSEWGYEEILLDKLIQNEYHRKAEELVIAFVSGSRAGGLDHQRSEELKNVIIKNENEIDWFATYKLRQRVQEGYRKADELNRNRR